jgi:Flp pilus assembly protein TadG
MTPTRARAEAGAASVEFALVVPVLLLLVAIAGYFAWQMFTEASLERAAQRAARYAAVPTTEGAYAYRQCDVVADLNSQLTAFSVDSAGVTVSDSTGTALPHSTCPSTDVATRPRGWVRVRVTHTLDNPFASLLGVVTRRPGPIVLTGSGEARVEDPT